MIKRTVVAVLACGALIVMAASCGERISDTGYQGTWSRGNDKNTSTIALWQDAGEWRFTWFADSKSGAWRIRCDERLLCTETFEGRKTAEHAFRIWEDPADGNLRLECITTGFEPEALTTRYLDVLEVTDGGQKLWSYTLERDDQRFEGDGRPRRAFRKVSDRAGPAEPQ